MVSRGEAMFGIHLRAEGLDHHFTSEYKFDSKRRWRFDFADIDNKIAVEIEGGTWTKGRHTRGKGFQNDCEKYNEATRQGWKVYRFTTEMVLTATAIDFMKTVYEALQ